MRLRVRSRLGDPSRELVLDPPGDVVLGSTKSPETSQVAPLVLVLLLVLQSVLSFYKWNSLQLPATLGYITAGTSYVHTYIHHVKPACSDTLRIKDLFRSKHNVTLGFVFLLFLVIHSYHGLEIGLYSSSKNYFSQANFP